MDKLTKQQEDIISKMIAESYNEEITQFILNFIGEGNWSKRILSNCMVSFLTEEQKELSESFGYGYTFEEMVDKSIISVTNRHISERLKKMGVTKYLYENNDYIDDIRNKVIICEGIDVDEIMNVERIKKMIYD